MDDLGQEFTVGERLVSPHLHRIEAASGEPRSVEPRVMQVLVYLARHAGEVVSRERLLQEVWDGAAVSDEALTRAIFDLRKAFDDSAQDPKVVETIRKGGYRLIAPVRPRTTDPPAEPEPVEPQSVEPQPTDPKPASDDSQDRSSTARFFLYGMIAALAIVSIIGLSAVRIFSPDQGETREAVSARVQLTSFQGYETHPALSPDGRQLAFAWSGDQGENIDLYLKSIDGEVPLRLTEDPAIDDNPSFSPDGRKLAFIRRSPDACGLYVATLPGRDIRRVSECREAGVSAPAWSGNGLIFADRASPASPFQLIRLDLANREKTVLTEPAEGTFGDLYPTVSPDGRLLAFVRASARSAVTTYLSPARGDLYVVSHPPKPGETPRRLTFDQEEIPGAAWRPDGRRLIYASTREGLGYALWETTIEGDPPTLVFDGEGLLRHPAIAAQQSGLAFEQWTGSTDVYRLEIESEIEESGEDRELVARRGDPLISSTRSDFNPSYSADGERLVFTSLRTGFAEIWTSDADGSRPTRLTSFAGDRPGAPRFAPDDRRIVFEVQRKGLGSIFTVAADGGEPTRLTEETNDDRAPSWSNDGRRIYFASNRDGTWQVWKTSADAAIGGLERVTQNGGFAALESASGRLYYSKRDLGGIWTRDGTEERRVAESAPEHWGNWALVGERLYTVELTPDRTTKLLVRRLDVLQTPEREPVVAAVLEGWIGRETQNLTIRPDGRLVVYAQYRELAADLRYLDLR